VSPVKNSTNGSRKYFNLTLQGKSKANRAVCFSPERRQLFDTAAKTKSAISLKGCSKSRTSSDIIISKGTKIDVLAQEEIPSTFASFNEDLSNNRSFFTLTELINLAPDQLITVKGEVCLLECAKVININGNPLKKQEIAIRDPTGCMKVILYGNDVDTVTLNHTYEFANFRLKPSKTCCFLNTPKSGESTIKEVEKFLQPLAPFDSLDTSEEMEGVVVGIKSITKSAGCIRCGKTTEAYNDKLTKCVSCGTIQKGSQAKVTWTVRLILQEDLAMGIHQTELVAPDHIVKQIIPGFSTEEELLTNLLDKILKIKYDPIGKLVLEVL